VGRDFYVTRPQGDPVAALGRDAGSAAPPRCGGGAGAARPTAALPLSHHRASRGQPMAHRRVCRERIHREALPLQPVHDGRGKARRVPLFAEVRHLPQHRIPLLRRAPVRLHRARIGAGPARFSADASRGARLVGLDRIVARRGGVECASAMAERALHDARRRLAALARRARRIADSRHSPPRRPTRVGQSPRDSRWSLALTPRSSPSTKKPKMRDQIWFSAARAATFAINTSRPVALRK
jgi:hypothetical protein